MSRRPDPPARLALLAAALLLGSCDRGPAIPEVDLLLRVTTGAAEVEPGAAFPLTIVRVWSQDLVPVAWDDRALAPLVVHLEKTTRREDAHRVEETRRYRGYAFSRTDVRVPAPKLVARPRRGGPDRVVNAAPLLVRVKPVLDAASPGVPELPGEPLAEPARRWPYVAAAVVLLAALAAALLRRRRPAPPPPAPLAEPPPIADPADARALAALRRVRARDGAAPADLATDVADTVGVVRDYLSERFGLPTAERTSEEILADAALVRALPSPAHAALRDVLARGDRVKFAAHAPTAAERLGLLDSAEAFVRATTSPSLRTESGPPPPGSAGP